MTSPIYVCGHEPRELQRLERQSEVYQDVTRGLLLSAGLRPGMRVLDIGCGGGDVSLLAAEIVGEAGVVIGVDRAPEAIAAARARASRLGLLHVEFRETAVEDLALESQFDALTGRFVLMHQRHPARVLRQALRSLRPGGVVALIESDLAASLAAPHSRPHSASYDRILRLFVSIVERSGSHADLGLRLPAVMRDAGLPAPVAELHARLECDAETLVRRYMIESLHSMWPSAERLGIGGLSPAAIDALERELLADTAPQRTLVAPLVVSARCRVPGT